MKARKDKIVTITLILEEEEAFWLKSIMQNPMIINDFESEKNKTFT